MYSPNIPERFIPILYRLGRARGQPMTRLVAEAIERYLDSEGWLPASADPRSHDRDRDRGSRRAA